MTLNEGEQEPGPFDITQTSTGKGQVKNEIMYCTKFHHCAKCSIKPHQLLTNQTALGVCKLFAGHNEASKVQILVSWCFEPSQPQRIISGLKTNFNLSRSYSFHGLLYPKSPFLKPQLKLSTVSEHKPRKTITHGLEPVYIPWALNTGTCIQQGDLLYSAGLHRNEKNRERFWKKMQVNGPEG